MNSNTFLNKIKRIPVTDWLVLNLEIWGFILATPLFANQLMNPKLVKPLDILWNLALDIVILTAAGLVFYVLRRLLRKFNHWVTRVER